MREITRRVGAMAQYQRRAPARRAATWWMPDDIAHNVTHQQRDAGLNRGATVAQLRTRMTSLPPLPPTQADRQRQAAEIALLMAMRTTDGNWATAAEIHRKLGARRAALVARDLAALYCADGDTAQALGRSLVASALTARAARLAGMPVPDTVARDAALAEARARDAAAVELRARMRARPPLGRAAPSRVARSARWP
jgi:hypothetical protein